MLFYKNIVMNALRFKDERDKTLHSSFVSPGVIKKFVILFVVSFSFFCLANQTGAATYYVDATDGDDTNAGTSQGAPWQTIAKVNSSTFSPGDQILFKKGETWREQLTVPSSGSAGSPITFGNYGIGANPLIFRTNSYSNWWEHSIITNGAFEVYTGTLDDGTDDSFNGWTVIPDEHGKIEVVSDSNTGIAAAKYTKLVTTTSNALLRKGFSVSPNTDYYFEFFGKRNAGTGACRVAIRDSNNSIFLYEDGTWGPNTDGEVLHPTSLRVTESSYTLKSKSFTTTADTTFLNVDLTPKYNEIATCTWDDVYLIQGTTKSTAKVWAGYSPTTTNSWGLIDDSNRVPIDISITNPLNMLDGYFYKTSDSGYFYYRKDSGNPGTKEVGARKYGIHISGKSYVVIDGMDVYGPGGKEETNSTRFYGINLDLSASNVTVKNNRISYTDNVGIWADNTTSNITYDTILVHDNESTGIYMNSSIGTIVNSKSYNNGQVITDTGDMGGIGVFEGGDITITENEVYNNSRSNQNADFEVSVVSLTGPVTISKNYIYDCIQGCVQINNGGDGSIISNNIINGFGSSSVTGVASGKFSGIRLGSNTSGTPNVKVVNNIVANGSTNNEFLSAGLSVRYAGSDGMTVKNNIFYNNAVPDVIFYSDTDTTTTQINYNNYYRPSYTNAWNWKATNYSTIATWQAASSQDAQSIISDPIFTNVAGNDFTLQSSSPAIDAGENLGSPYNFGLSPESVWPDSVSTLNQNSYGAGWEMGAYVYNIIESLPPVQSSSRAGQFTPSEQARRIISMSTPVADEIEQGSGAITFNFTSNLELGTRGLDVVELQDRLRAEGYFSVDSTGYFGLTTYGAVRAYQSAYGIPDTGFVGPITRAMLNITSSPSDEAQSVPATDFSSVSSLTPEEKQLAISQIRTKLASLIQQLIVLLQQQVSNM